MNILITAGGTTEDIDSVRYLANHATGSLGRTIAETMATHVSTIFYVHGPNATLPTLKNVKFYPIRSVRDLEQSMKDILTTNTIDMVIHSMAVSDYELDYTTSETEMAEKLSDVIYNQTYENKKAMSDDIENLLKEYSKNKKQFEKKIRSTSDQLIVTLKKAPKIIKYIKTWQPSTTLVGFKLLVGVPESDLLAAAYDSISKNKADYIVANDLEKITPNKHVALLIDKNGIQSRFNTKKEIAEGLLQQLLD